SSHLSRSLSDEGAKLVISDIYEDKVSALAKEVNAEVVDPDDIYGEDVDIFSPCALGGVVNNETLEQLSCDIIAGSANNVLDDEEKHGQMLVDQGILYAPDYVINAGGLINVASELEGYNEKRAKSKATHIYETILDIYRFATDNDTTTLSAANKLAEERMQQIGDIHKMYTSESNFSGHIGEMYSAK